MDGVRMKIQTKFGVSSLIVLILLAGLVGGSLLALTQAKKTAAARQRTAADVTQAVNTVHGSWLKVNDEIHDLLRLGFNAEDFAEDFQQLRRAIEDYVGSLKILESLMPMAPELGDLRSGRDTVVELLEKIDTLIATKSPEVPAVATALEETAQSIDDVIEEQMRRPIKEAEEEQDLALAGLEQVVKVMQTATLAIVGAIFLVIGGQFVLMLRPTIQSIQKLTFGAAEIGKGKLDYRLDIRTRDEVAQLGHTFNQMAANLGISYRSLEAAKEQIEAYSRALQGELDKGRQLQQDFLPYSLPQPPGWDLAASLKPARDVSGDFYDAFELPDNMVAVVIGDVCDKGVGSALFMALCRSLLRIFSIQPHSDTMAMQLGAPSTTLGRASDPQLTANSGSTTLLNAVVFTNSYIAQTHSHTNMFTTLFFGILDPSTGLLRYINGGHEPPAILGAGGIKTRLSPTGPAVGLFPDVGFEVCQTYLEAGICSSPTPTASRMHAIRAASASHKSGCFRC
jgi:methyl-accepting chemotaxis protein